ncbi:MAG: TylF/MycF/NovP-related O-methyltransferase [Acidobacteriota bacterium]
MSDGQALTARVGEWIVRLAVGGAWYPQRKSPRNALPATTVRAVAQACAAARGWKRLFDLNRVYLLATAARQIEEDDIPGAVIEVGVHRGWSAALLRSLFPGRPLLLFDTFRGFPAEDVDLDPMLFSGVPRDILGGLFRDIDLERVKAVVGAQGDTRYHVGRFPDSASRVVLPESCCLVHLDCDLLEPTRAALEVWFPRLAPGGFLVVHDYANPHWRGVRMAVDSYFSSRSERPVIWPDSGGSACLRRFATAQPW